jgi:hypothetical protein
MDAWPLLSSSWARLRGTPLRTTLRALRPQSVDEFLYIGPADRSERKLGAITPVADMQIAYFTPASPSGVAAIDSRLGAGRHCFVASLGPEIVHQSWVFFGSLLLSQFGYAKGAALIGDCVTEPHFRGRGIYSAVLIEADAKLTSVTGAAPYVLVSPANTGSIRGIERAGYRRLAHLTGLRVGPLLLRRKAS